jgi:SulP family sulfate permease
LGVFVPLVAALVLVNGLDPGAILMGAGVLVLAAGFVFRIPFPVQPLKALTALAVAQAMSAGTIHAAGIEIGLILAVLAVSGFADRLSHLFTRPVIRSLQFAVGTLLVLTAFRLATDPPAIFEDPPDPAWGVALAAVTLLVVAGAVATRRYVLVGGLFAVGVVIGLVVAPVDFGEVAPRLPDLVLPDWSVAGTAFVLLVIPQLPLTYGNAIVGVSDLAHEQFGAQARRVTPGRVALSCGLGNLAAAVIGGMPMCHGSSGFTAHVRLGARHAAMNLILGSTFLIIGVVFGDQVLALFGLLPVWALSGFLAYAGVRHAGLVIDLRGSRLALALGAGLIGVVTGNLAVTTAVALVAEHGPRLWRRSASTVSAPVDE